MNNANTARLLDETEENAKAESIRQLTADEQALLDRSASSEQDAQPSEWPDEILHPAGLVGRFADYITANVASPQPKFSLAVSLATFGALLGRGVKDATGQYTNLYALALGFSSSGKSEAMRYATQVCGLLNRQKIVVEQVCSDSAEEILLYDFPIRFHVLDEVGHYFGSMKSAGQNNPHLKTVIPMLTKLWSCAYRDGTYTGKSRCPQVGKEWKPPAKIKVPTVSVYATGTPNRLFDALTFDDLIDGAIVRYLCFISETIPPLNVKPEKLFPPDLLGEISGALTALGLTDDKYNGTNAAPEAVTIGETEEARQRLNDFSEQCRDNLRKAESDNDQCLYLYGKGGENARRVALILACTRDPQSPTVTLADADTAIGIVSHSISDMIRGVRQHVARNQREREAKIVENVIRRAELITQSNLTLKTRTLDQRDRRSILLDLSDSGLIKEELVQGKGKKLITVYRWIGGK